MGRLPVVTVFTCAVAMAGTAPSARQSGSDTALSRTAVATLKTADGKTVGEASLRETGSGVLVHLKLTGAPAGTRAVHVHTTGKCEAPSFESAGPHFNPTKAAHGFDSAKGPHAGDLPNLHVPSGGTLEVELLAGGATLGSGANSLADTDGSAIVLHAGADDYKSDPAGNAGDRVACGVIQIKN